MAHRKFRKVLVFMAIFKKEEAFPDYNYNCILDITPDDIIRMGAKAVAVDLDNTAAEFGSYRLLEGMKEWTDNMIDSGIKVIIITNTWITRAYILSRQMRGVSFIPVSLKPLTISLKIAARMLDIELTEMAMIGDKLSSDILAANRAGSIAVKVIPLSRLKRQAELPQYLFGSAK